MYGHQRNRIFSFNCHSLPCAYNVLFCGTRAMGCSPLVYTIANINQSYALKKCKGSIWHRLHFEFMNSMNTLMKKTITDY